MFNLPFVPIRKKNKLPGEKAIFSYKTEYSNDDMELQKDSINGNSKILVVDDLLATGGTFLAGEYLIKECGGSIAGYFVVFEIDGLKGRNRLAEPDALISLIHI